MDAANELAAEWEACREPNWDGFGALRVEHQTMRTAGLFLESLPTDVPPLSVGAEPDGAFTFEWHHAARRTLSVSVGPDGLLHYAGLFGPERVYGSDSFYGRTPPRILDLIRCMYAT